MTRINAVMCDAISEDIGSVSVREVDLPAPGPGEVRVRLYACAVNFPDLLMIQGKYQFKPPLPFAPGGEAAGDAPRALQGAMVEMLSTREEGVPSWTVAEWAPFVAYGL